MKKLLIFSVLTSLLLTGCFLRTGIKGSGTVTKEQRTVLPFNQVEIASGPFTVYLSQGDTESVEVEIDDNLQPYVKVRNEGSKLVVDLKDKVNIGKTTKNNINITLKNIDLLSLNGVCKLKTLGALNGDFLTFNVRGVADCELELHYDKLNFSGSGVGNVELRGSATELSVNQSGVGNFNAGALKADKANVVNSGVGSVSVDATHELSMSNTGVGSITYSGDAEIKAVHSSGVGKISKAK
jgi:hypothetical protein